MSDEIVICPCVNPVCQEREGILCPHNHPHRFDDDTCNADYYECRDSTCVPLNIIVVENEQPL